MQEVELLFKINEGEIKKLHQTLQNFFVEKIKEIDVYFYPPNRDFLVSKNGRENLRVRENDNEKELTYKKVIYNNGKYSHSIEKNVNVSNTNDIIEILKMLGFRIYLKIEKQREVYIEKNFKLTIDNVEGLGMFIEVEWTGKDGNENEIRNACQKRSNELGLYMIQDKGYLRLIEEKMLKLNEH